MGDPSSTGYGVFGSKTRAAYIKECIQQQDEDDNGEDEGNDNDDSGTTTPDATLEANPDGGEKPLEVTFTVNGHEKTTYTLDFGDRSIKKRVKDGDTVEHTYKKTGTFVARLLSRVGGSISLLKYNHNVSGVLDTVKIIVSDEEEDDDSNDESSTFTISDVKSVTKKSVDPIPLAVDDEYSLYTITLKDGDIIRVKSCGFCTTQMREKLFTDKGFEGSVSELMSLASNENDEDEDDGPTSSTANSCVTPYYNKNVSHGTYVDGYSKYFWQGPMPLTVVSPARLCQNGSWTHGGYCNLNGVKCSI
jgi:PKD repeat protein